LEPVLKFVESARLVTEGCHLALEVTGVSQHRNDYCLSRHGRHLPSYFCLLAFFHSEMKCSSSSCVMPSYSDGARPVTAHTFPLAPARASASSLRLGLVAQRDRGTPEPRPELVPPSASG